MMISRVFSDEDRIPKSFEAYMTVEAALIVPMVICSIVLMMYIAFHLFAVCLLTEDMYILGIRGSRLDYGSTYDSGAAYVEDNKENMTQGRYFGNTVPQITVTENRDQIVLSGESETHHDAMGRYFLMPMTGWDIRITEKLMIENQVKRIREVTRAKDLLGINTQNQNDKEDM